MTLQVAIETLRQVGPVTIEGGMICCDVPDPTPAEVDRALDVLRERKPEALALLGWRPEPDPRGPPSVSRPSANSASLRRNSIRCSITWY